METGKLVEEDEGRAGREKAGYGGSREGNLARREGKGRKRRRWGAREL